MTAFTIGQVVAYAIILFVGYYVPKRVAKKLGSKDRCQVWQREVEVRNDCPKSSRGDCISELAIGSSFKPGACAQLTAPTIGCMMTNEDGIVAKTIILPRIPKTLNSS